MNASRLQHIIPAGAIFALAMTVTWLSFTQEPAEAFVFPRIISIAFIILASWNLARAGLGMARVGGGLSSAEARHIFPDLCVFCSEGSGLLFCLGYRLFCRLFDL